MILYQYLLFFAIFVLRSASGTHNFFIGTYDPALDIRNPALGTTRLPYHCFYSLVHNLLPVRNSRSFHNIVFPVQV